MNASLEPASDTFHGRVKDTAVFLRSWFTHPPQTLIILGTGLDSIAEKVTESKTIAYRDIPFFLPRSVTRHSGFLLSGKMNGLSVAILVGRFHYYEGFSAAEVAFPVMALARAGVRNMIITNCAGGLNPQYRQGDIMIIRDHMNFIPDNPLRGYDPDGDGLQFTDMSEAYDREFVLLAREASQALGMDGKTVSGVYGAVTGPSLETPAETRFLRLLGADAVGMSTVPEVIAARHGNMRVLGLSVIANVNDPDNFKPIAVSEVLAAMKMAAPDAGKLVADICRRWNVTERCKPQPR